jgi:hypothetical protein
LNFRSRAMTAFAALLDGSYGFNGTLRKWWLQNLAAPSRFAHPNCSLEGIRRGSMPLME